jgi:hypothetical protein
VSESVKVKVGNEYVSQAVPSDTSDGTTTNKIGDLEAIGQSRVYIGDSHGSKGFLTENSYLSTFIMAALYEDGIKRF